MALNIGSICLSLVMWMHNNVGFLVLLLPTLGVLLCLICWGRNLLDENDLGLNNQYVVNTRRNGLAIFIFSEALTLFLLFWAFFYLENSPPANLDSIWPPLDVESPNPFSDVLFNVGLVVSSSLYCYLAQKAIHRCKHAWAPLSAVGYSIIWGVMVLRYKFHESYIDSLSITESAPGMSFYILTGFHGFNIIIGILWFLVSVCRLILRRFFRRKHNFGFEFCFCYWLFVDVAWVLSYCFIN